MLVSRHGCEHISADLEVYTRTELPSSDIQDIAMASASGGQQPPDKGMEGIPKPPSSNVGSTGTTKKAAKYADITKKKGDNWLTFHLFREDQSISYNLSKKDRANLLFKRLKIPPQNVKSFEACDFERIRIEFKGDINIEKYKNSEAIAIRPGLKVQPLKEVKRTTRIKICWVEIGEEQDKQILETLKLFGRVEGNLEYLTYEVTEEEMADENLSHMKNIRNGERAVEIEIHQPIPSFVKIAGKRARIWHRGQNFTCSRCYKSFRSCPGKADRKECKKNNGQERDFEDFWKEISNRVPVKERMEEGDTYKTDTIDICKVPKETSKEDLLKFLGEEDVEVHPNNLKSTTFPGTWRIINISSSDLMDKIVQRMHGISFRGTRLLFIPIQLPTPMKEHPGGAQAGPAQPGAGGAEAGTAQSESTATPMDLDNNKQKEDEAEKVRQEKRKEEEAMRESVERERLRLSRERETETLREAKEGPINNGKEVTSAAKGPRGLVGGEAQVPTTGEDGEESRVSNSPNLNFLGLMKSNVQSLFTFGASKDKTVLDNPKKSPPVSEESREDDNSKLDLKRNEEYRRRKWVPPPANGSPALTQPNPEKIPPLGTQPTPKITVESDKNNDTIDSSDEIFTQDYDTIKAPLNQDPLNPVFQSEFARRLSQSRSRSRAGSTRSRAESMKSHRSNRSRKPTRGTSSKEDMALPGKRGRETLKVDSPTSSSSGSPAAKAQIVGPESPEEQEEEEQDPVDDDGYYDADDSLALNLGPKSDFGKKMEEEKEKGKGEASKVKVVAKDPKTKLPLEKLTKELSIPPGFSLTKTQKKKMIKKMKKAEAGATSLSEVESPIIKGKGKKVEEEEEKEKQVKETGTKHKSKK